jgi:hypothetical protein
MKKTVKKEAKHKAVGAFVLSLSIFFAAFLSGAAFAERPEASEVWEKAENLGARYDIDPLLIFSIACAESSLNPEADSGVARGLMQMTSDAWKDATKRPYSDAWDWKANMDGACAYIAILKGRLERSGRLSPANLVAAYHFGPGRLEKAGYDFSRLPEVKNFVYRDILAGKAPRLPEPAPSRALGRRWRSPAQVFAQTEKPLSFAPLVSGALVAGTGDVKGSPAGAPSPLSAALPAIPAAKASSLLPDLADPAAPLALPTLTIAKSPGALDFGPLLHWEGGDGSGETTLVLPELDRSATPGESDGEILNLPVLNTDGEPSAAAPEGNAPLSLQDVAR